jgi:hypothetical protein
VNPINPSNLLDVLKEDEYNTRIRLANIHHFMGERIKDMSIDDLKVTLVSITNYYGQLHAIKKDFELKENE